jgi:undecaprenyl-diphosphatase
MNLLEASILAVVEGLTEYLPISSTGHIILVSDLLGLHNHPFVADYTVVVQCGAIFSVLVIYWRNFFHSINFYKKLFVATLPAIVIGFTIKNKIDILLNSLSIVAWALFVGGIFLIVFDKKLNFEETQSTKDADNLDLSYKQALLIGLSQCLAFVPGVSRSAASIIGGMWQNLNRKQAAEFSFFLAVPTLFGATAIKMIKIVPTITSDQIQILLIGNLISFVVGFLTIKTFIQFLSRTGFKTFGWYRIIIGLIFLYKIYG